MQTSNKTPPNHSLDRMVMVAVKTPMMAHATTSLLPSHLTLAQSLQEIRRVPPKDDSGRRVLQQLDRETSSGRYDFLVINKSGEIEKCDPATALATIALPREIRTPRGVELLPTVAFELQAYAPVGANART